MFVDLTPFKTGKFGPLFDTPDFARDGIRGISRGAEKIEKAKDFLTKTDDDELLAFMFTEQFIGGTNRYPFGLLSNGISFEVRARIIEKVDAKKLGDWTLAQSTKPERLNPEDYRDTYEMIVAAEKTRFVSPIFHMSGVEDAFVKKMSNDPRFLPYILDAEDGLNPPHANFSLLKEAIRQGVKIPVEFYKDQQAARMIAKAYTEAEPEKTNLLIQQALIQRASGKENLIK